MQDLIVGLTHQHQLTISEQQTVPWLYPQSAIFQQMPSVFATGFMVGFLEWACIEAIHPYLDWPRQMSLGTAIDVSHEAATPAGRTVVADVELIVVDGKRLRFAVSAHDGVATISRGFHERFVIDKARFEAGLHKH